MNSTPWSFLRKPSNCVFPAKALTLVIPVKALTLVIPAKAGIRLLALPASSEFVVRFRPPRRRTSPFLLRAQEKVTKEKGNPRSRFLGLLPKKSVSRGRGFRRYVRVPAKTDAHPARPPSGLIVPASPRPRGPKSGTRRARQKQRAASFGPSLLIHPPVDRGGGPEDQPRQRARAGCARGFRRYMDVPSESPAGPTRTRRSRARSPGRLSLVTFFGEAKKVTRSPPRRTKSCDTETSCEKSRDAGFPLGRRPVCPESVERRERRAPQMTKPT